MLTIPPKRPNNNLTHDIFTQKWPKLSESCLLPASGTCRLLQTIPRAQLTISTGNRLFIGRSSAIENSPNITSKLRAMRVTESYHKHYEPSFVIENNIFIYFWHS